MYNSSDTIEHFGVKGMRWGHRNRREYLTKKYIAKGYNPKAARDKAKKRIGTEGKLKKAALIGGGVALAGLAAYGGYKGLKHLKGLKVKKAKNILSDRSAFDKEMDNAFEDVFKKLQKENAIDIRKVRPIFDPAHEARYNKAFNKTKQTVQDSVKTIHDRHKFAGSEMKRTFDSIRKQEDPAHAARMSKMNADIDSMLNDLLGKSSMTRRGANGRRIKDVTNSLKG